MKRVPLCGHRRRAVDRSIALLRRRIEIVDALHDIDDFRLSLGDEEKDLHRKVLAEELCAKHYRRKLRRLHFLRPLLQLRYYFQLLYLRFSPL